MVQDWFVVLLHRNDYSILPPYEPLVYEVFCICWVSSIEYLQTIHVGVHENIKNNLKMKVKMISSPNFVCPQGYIQCITGFSGVLMFCINVFLHLFCADSLMSIKPPRGPKLHI